MRYWWTRTAANLHGPFLHLRPLNRPWILPFPWVLSASASGTPAPSFRWTHLPELCQTGTGRNHLKQSNKLDSKLKLSRNFSTHPAKLARHSPHWPWRREWTSADSPPARCRRWLCHPRCTAPGYFPGQNSWFRFTKLWIIKNVRHDESEQKSKICCTVVKLASTQHNCWNDNLRLNRAVKLGWKCKQMVRRFLQGYFWETSSYSMLSWDYVLSFK